MSESSLFPELDRAIMQSLKDDRIARKAMGGDVPPALVPKVARLIESGASAADIRAAIESMKPRDRALDSLRGDPLAMHIYTTLRDGHSSTAETARYRVERDAVRQAVKSTPRTPGRAVNYHNDPYAQRLQEICSSGSAEKLAGYKTAARKARAEDEVARMSPAEKAAIYERAIKILEDE